jgi:hypothetical protein
MSEDPMLAGQELVERLPQILQQVEAVSHLHRLGGCLTGAVGKGSTAITTQHLHLSPTVSLQPARECGSVSVGQQIDHPMLVEIHQHRAVVAAEGELIDSQHAQVRRYLVGRGDLRPAQEPEQGVAARPSLTQPQAPREALSGLPTEREAHGFQALL